MIPNDTGFTGKKRALIDRLSLSPYPGLLEAARAEGISLSTAKRWNMDPAFKEAWHEARDEAQAERRAEAKARIASLVPKAIDGLDHLVQFADREDVRLNAIKDVLDRDGLKPADRHEHTGKDGTPIAHAHRLDLSGFSHDELRDIRSRLLGRGRTPNRDQSGAGPE